MWRRCTNPRRPQFRYYGGRGIRVCERWRDFSVFLSDMGERPSPAHSPDRIDNDRGYEPGNVRWATQREQTRNRRTNVIVTAFGRAMTLAAWAEGFGINESTLRERLRRGWLPERAVTQPPHGVRP